MHEDGTGSTISRRVWTRSYRLPGEHHIADSLRRVAGALAEVESTDRDGWRMRFVRLLQDHAFLPGGRILAGAGSNRDVTLFNCFVMGAITDSMDGIFDALRQGAVTMQMGGGVGYDFSTLRPGGMPARRVGSTASGPVSFMHVWDSMCATVQSTGFRRGAMMATLRCDHPDIERFVDAKRDAAALRHFNLSVLVSDAFMEAVREGSDWPLIFPDDSATGAQRMMTDWPGHKEPVPCRVFRRLDARALWQRMMRAAYDCAEPGVLFIDRINRLNNLSYCETISATNPCGEIPLPPFGACNLGSFNLVRFIRAPFTTEATFDFAALEASVPAAVRMLDNVIDVSRFPLPQQRDYAHASRRIGLGVTGLADALVLLGLDYGSAAGRDMAGRIMRTICHAAYRASIALAREKETFDLYQRDGYLASPFVSALPVDIREGIARFGLRNSHLLAIAPTGTISLLAGNVSSGIEPIFAARQQRRIGDDMMTMEDYALRLWQRLGHRGLPQAFVDSRSLAPAEHLAMQATLQAFVDNAISKTVNVPPDFSFTQFESLYQQADALGLKGCTAFRPNPVTGVLLRGCAPCELPAGGASPCY